MSVTHQYAVYIYQMYIIGYAIFYCYFDCLSRDTEAETYDNSVVDAGNDQHTVEIHEVATVHRDVKTRDDANDLGSYLSDDVFDVAL